MFSEDMIDTEKEKTRVSNSLQRARYIGAPATLTLDEWLDNLVLFGGLCAYCQKVQFEVLDHLYPIAAGGGTTQRNSIPSCRDCNYKKGTLIGDTIDETSTLVEAVERTLATLHSNPNVYRDFSKRWGSKEGEKFHAMEVRIPNDLYEEIKESAKVNHRSLNGEVIHQLSMQIQQEDTT